MIEIRGSEKLQRRLGTNLYKPAIRSLLRDTGLFAEEQLRRRAPGDTNELKGSFVSDVTPLSLPVRSQAARAYSPLQYAAVQDQGRRPGSTPPPARALEGWLRRHGNFTNVYALARSIGRKGYPGKHFLRPALEATRREFGSLIRSATTQIERDWKARR